MTVLQTAETWGVPPWVVAAANGEEQAWFWRQLEWNKAQEKRQKLERKEAEHGIRK